MKKIGIINSQISAAIASLGHSDTLTIVDAGYPVPTTTERIDLALEPGVPGFLQTLKVVLGELFVERIVLPKRSRAIAPISLRAFKPYYPISPFSLCRTSSLKSKSLPVGLSSAQRNILPIPTSSWSPEPGALSFDRGDIQ
jgi:D-ribose pyranase